MITIPIWAFVILCVLAGLMLILIVLFLVSLIGAVLTPSYEYKHEDYDCPYEIEDNPDYNPEHIPHVERED